MLEEVMAERGNWRIGITDRDLIYAIVEHDGDEERREIFTDGWAKHASFDTLIEQAELVVAALDEAGATSTDVLPPSHGPGPSPTGSWPEWARNHYPVPACVAGTKKPYVAAWLRGWWRVDPSESLDVGQNSVQTYLGDVRAGRR